MTPQIFGSHTVSAYTTALFALQGEVEAIKKDAKNPFFKSNYATINQIWEVLLPLLQKHGFLVEQLPVGENELATIVTHVPSGEWRGWVGKMALKETNPQAQGSAITYFCRYTLVAAFRLLTEDDDANVATQPATLVRLPQRHPTRTNT